MDEQVPNILHIPLSPPPPQCFQIHVPHPPRVLSPNSRTSWQAKIRPKKKYREHCQWIAMKLKAPNHKPFLRAELWITWNTTTRRRPDPDNVVAILKTAIDALTAAGVLADDRDLVIQPVKFQLVNKGSEMANTATLFFQARS